MLAISSTSPIEILRTARFSRCGRYRYVLTRRWEGATPRVASGRGRVVFVMLNPSTADATRDDPTIRRCMGLARSWGFAAVDVVNLFAWRATRPVDLRRAARALDPEHARANWRAVFRAAKQAELVVVAWGNHGAWREAGHEMLARLVRLCGPRIACLGLTKLGHPRHVLYLRRDVRPEPMAPQPVSAT